MRFTLFTFVFALNNAFHSACFKVPTKAHGTFLICSLAILKANRANVNCLSVAHVVLERVGTPVSSARQSSYKW
jgi:hypothetical protein